MKVYTCTMNLAIDLFIETKDLLPNTVNRTLDSDILANGKGVNVSFILKELQHDSIALGFSAGFTGDFIRQTLEEKKIKTKFIDIPGISRINVFTKVNHENNEYKLVNSGPDIPDESQKELLEQINQMMPGDFLVISGSFPPNVPPEILIKISEICHDKNINLIIDVSHPIVMECLKYRPFLLKPNEEELAIWFNKSEINSNEIELFLRETQKLGGQRVLLSTGKDGATFLDKDQKLYKANAPVGQVVNTACSGDTLLATFLAGIIEEKNIQENLSKSVAAGSSTAFRSGLTDFGDVPQLQEQITVIEVK